MRERAIEYVKVRPREIEIQHKCPDLYLSVTKVLPEGKSSSEQSRFFSPWPVALELLLKSSFFCLFILYCY